jgi:hypothetical protein
MEQSKLISLVEVCLNVAIGFVVSMVIWPFVGAMFDIEYSLARHWGITAIFTVVAIARGYIIRRFFAQDLHKAAYRLAQKWSRS